VKAALPAEDKVLVLRSCRPDGACCSDGHGGKPAFVWPKSGPVACDDFDPSPRCGHGLHGLLWGEGQGRLLDWTEDAAWLVVEVLASEIVEIAQDGWRQGQVPARRGGVLRQAGRRGRVPAGARAGR
jgi:hypothetical protein